MPVSTIEWDGDFNGRIKIVDQTVLPGELKFIFCEDTKSIWDAIKELKVRGAPAIGIAAAMGTFIGARDIKTDNTQEFLSKLDTVISYIGSSRPTAVNLFTSLKRMDKVAKENSNESVDAIKKQLLNEAIKIHTEDKKYCRKIGANGAEYIKDGMGILTHCNAGGLATADFGTALAVMFSAHNQGKKIHVFVDETRPLLQGARLTAWELMNADINATLICDNMAAYVMQQGKVDCVIVGADRIAGNGDAANKIGTYGLSILAKEHKIPFYVAAPISTFDFNIKSGKEIPIEERNAEEITEGFGKRTAPKGVKVFNPAFDVTPAGNITAIFTERGVITNPDSTKIKALSR
ncbi:MAG: S-methyl-5-thioribose-1-phosphate isomerase [Candidatus Anammoxibacter sp.]